MDRRHFLLAGISAAGLAVNRFRSLPFRGVPLRSVALRGVARPTEGRFATTVEVIGDGDWVWRRPPADARGILEPRRFSFWTRIALRGVSNTGPITAGTAIPLNWPEQTIVDSSVETRGCAARLEQVSPAAGQLSVSCPALAAGQTAFAVAKFELSLAKQYFAYTKEMFPVEQKPSEAIRREYLYQSPGIQVRAREVRRLADELTGNLSHPWDKARVFKKWVWENIESEGAMRYTGVVTAIRTGRGDCEERASVFAALCRTCGIPTRTVWVPNHVWAEFYLLDKKGEGHWIPAHTSGYTWFGLTGAPELILQKGDGVLLPGRRREMRFLHDWAKFNGPRAEVQYTAELTPLAEGQRMDPGPGGRIKPVSGPWGVGRHPLDRYLLNGDDTKDSPFRKFRSEVSAWE